MAPRMAPADVIAEEGCEVSALVAELRASMVRIWEAAQASGHVALLAEARELAPDMAEVERHSKRIAALAERAA